MSSKECNALQGIAIMSILLHNFCHDLPGAVPENEFEYRAENHMQFWSSVFHSDFFIQIFSYWGHLGVPVFVFLSGYGLVKKYDTQTNVGWVNFLFSHFKKLFIPLTIATIVINIILRITMKHWVESWGHFWLQTTMLLNLSTTPTTHIPGAYWYFGMALQLYALYRLLVYNHSSKLIIIALVICETIMITLDHESQTLVWMNHNAFGWLLPFSIGILAARHCPKHTIPLTILGGVFLASVLFIISASFTYYSWLLIPGIIIITAVSFLKLLSPRILDIAATIGKVSFPIYVIHPIIRMGTMPLVEVWGTFCTLELYVFLTLFFSFLFLSKNTLRFRKK